MTSLMLTREGQRLMALRSAYDAVWALGRNDVEAAKDSARALTAYVDDWAGLLKEEACDE